MSHATQPQTLAVVPIVVNAGAALFPALLAGLVSVAAVLLRPKEWGRVARERPYVPVLIVVVIASIVGWFFFWPTSAAGGGTRGRGTAVRGDSGLAVDWTAVALDYLRDKTRAAVPPAQPILPTPGAMTEPGEHAVSGSPATAAPFIDRMNALRGGYAFGPSPIKLTELWQHVDPEDKFAMYCASMAFSPQGDWVYGASATLTPPDSSGAIFCLSGATGTPRWPAAFEVPDEKGQTRPLRGIFSSPAITADGTSLIVGEGLHTDRNSALLCFDTLTGKLRWRVPTTLHLESSPAIEGDLAVIGVGAVERPGDEKVAPGDDPGFVLAVRISDGKELWRFAVNDPEGPPAIVDGVVYVGSGVNGSEIVALRTQSDDAIKAAGQSRVVWRTKTPFPALGAVTVTDQLVLTGCGDGNFVRPGPHGTVVALDRKTGNVLWQTGKDVTAAAVLAPVAVRGTLGVIGVGNGEVVAIDLANKGALVWRRAVSDSAPVNAGCAVTDSLVYALSADGWLAVLKASDGTLVERHFVNDSARPGELGMSVSGPIVIGGKVYVGSETGGVRAFTGAAK